MRCVPAGRRVPTGSCSRELHVRVDAEPGELPELVILTARQSPANFAAGFVETDEPPRIALQYVPFFLEQIRAEVEHALSVTTLARQD
jgi:hypothetical protein